MSSVILAQSSHLNNADLEKFVQKTVELLKLESVQGINAAANPSVYKRRFSKLQVGKREVKEYSGVAEVVATKFRQKPAEIKKTIGLDLGRNLEVSRQIRRFAVNVEAPDGILEQVDLKQHFAFINGRNFSEKTMNTMVEEFNILAENDSAISVADRATNELRDFSSRFGAVVPTREIEGLIATIGATESSGSRVVLNKGLSFRIHEVRCIDETNPEWIGSDSISWGGVAAQGVDNKEKVTKLKEYLVGSSFDDGDVKKFSPPKILHNFQLDQGNFPKDFLVLLSLAEKDSGGMSTFIQELYEAVKAHLQVILTALGAAAGAAIGAAIGGSVGTAIGGPLGLIIGIVAGAVVGALAAWLASALKDDIFMPEEAAIRFKRANETFAGGSLTSPRQYIHYRDHGGHYRVAFDWRISR